MGRSPFHKRLFFKFQSITSTKMEIALQVILLHGKIFFGPFDLFSCFRTGFSKHLLGIRLQAASANHDVSLGSEKRIIFCALLAVYDAASTRGLCGFPSISARLPDVMCYTAHIAALHAMHDTCKCIAHSSADFCEHQATRFKTSLSTWTCDTVNMAYKRAYCTPATLKTGMRNVYLHNYSFTHRPCRYTMQTNR